VVQTHDIEHETRGAVSNGIEKAGSTLPYEAMMSRERQKDFVYQENMLEIVDHGLSV
jgi:hypothetical protein